MQNKYYFYQLVLYCLPLVPIIDNKIIFLRLGVGIRIFLIPSTAICSKYIWRFYYVLEHYPEQFRDGTDCV